MNSFATFMLLAWVPITMVFFSKMKPHQAVLAAVIGGWLLLPMGVAFDVSGLPGGYTKRFAIAFGLLVSGGLSRRKHGESFHWSIYDLPMLLFCLSPIPSSLTNELGLYNGVAGAADTAIAWGVPYYAGRLHFNTAEKIRNLCLGIVIGGIVYAFLALWEIRMSPRLSINIYGFFPHEWRQHRRYGGWRPIVFMQHGLMVALWMAAATTAAFWLWKSRIVRQIRGVPMGFVVALMAITTVLCKSANGWFTLVLGFGSYYLYRRSRSNRALLFLLLAIPLYAVLSIYGVIEGEHVAGVAARVFDDERVASLSIRLLQEDLFIESTMDRFLFGWGRTSYAWPTDDITGRLLVTMIDSLWLILFSLRGIFGLSTWITAMLIGPWLVLRTVQKRGTKLEYANLPSAVLALIVVTFMIDSLVNGMVNPVYILSSGCLVSGYLAGAENATAPSQGYSLAATSAESDPVPEA